MSTIQDLPCEVLEDVFKCLPSANDQRILRLVCKKWRDVVQNMRRIPTIHCSKYEQLAYVRLPTAGSFNEIHGNQGFAVIFQAQIDLVLSGVSIFLPHPKENNQIYSKLLIKVDLIEHGVSQIGPSGQLLTSIEEEITDKEVRKWASDYGCGLKNKDKRQCLAGPSWLNRNRSFECRGIHPYPLFFASSQPLIQGVKYWLSFHLSSSEDPDIPVATIWGFQGVPRIKSVWQPLLRWKQVYRKGLSSSVSSGQFPVLYFIK